MIDGNREASRRADSVPQDGYRFDFVEKDNGLGDFR